MRKVVAHQLLALDGVAEEPGDWMFGIDHMMFDNLGAIIGRQDTVLLGRATYDYWAGYWPTADVQPFADFINRTPKHVFTSGELAHDWANTTVVTGPATDHVAQLKEQSGGDIGLHGSIRLTRSLLRAGLVDELRLVVSPAIAGHGFRLFEDDGELRRLDLIDVRHSNTGIVFLAYRTTDERAAPPH